jgi:sorting nexin-9/18/33
LSFLHTENEDDFLENRRRKLERFLNRVAKHPLLGSTKILHIFLIATTDKEWRIGTGKHTSIMKSSTHKGSKKFFAAPIYRTIHYPPYNVPINQLSAFDRFSKFSELLEGNLSIVMRSCEMLKASHGQVGRCYRNLGKDMQSLSKGIEPVPIVRHLRKPSQGPLVSLPSTHSSIITLVDTDRDEDDEEEDEEDNEAITGEWNWREDEKFTKLVSQLHDIGLKIRQLSSEHPHYQENIELDTIEVLEEYTNMIHTLPVLVRMHEEAMSYFNDSKQKGSKKDCETVRQDCETLNNILLSEFDYFSEVMIEDIQNLILNLLKQQAEYHRKLANEWENMYATFSEGRPTRKATLKRSSTIPNSKAFCLMEMQQRPASSDEKKDNLFKDYVNIEAVPLNDRSNEITKQHNLYTNIQQNVYENWTPTHTFNNATTPSSDDFSPSSPAEIVPVISPTKPIPPPLIIRRHEASTEPSEEPNTDSFIVPNLHYSQVNVGGPLNDGRLEQPVECRESSSTLTPSTPVKTKPHPPPKPALINSNKIIVKTEASDSDSFESSGEMEKGSLQQIHQTIPTKADQYILDSIVEEKVTDNSQYSPKMNTKLAKLTQLPPSTTLPYKKQSSIPQSLSLKSSEVSAPIASVRTLPKDSIAKTSIDDSSKTTELFKKLNERRQKLERQLSNDALPRQSNSNVASSTSSDSESTSEGVLRWTTESKEMDPNNSLVKYGIIEEGSTFTV